MIGIWANVAAIIVGTVIGWVFKKVLTDKYVATFWTALGLAALGGRGANRRRQPAQEPLPGPVYHFASDRAAGRDLAQARRPGQRLDRPGLPHRTRGSGGDRQFPGLHRRPGDPRAG